MGKTLKKIKKTLKGIGNLSYVEIRHVPMAHDPDYGFGIHSKILGEIEKSVACLLYTSPSPRDGLLSRMPSSA